MSQTNIPNSTEPRRLDQVEFNLLALPLDCLIEILSFVPIPECIFLRSTCSKLKAAVDEHFRTGVRTLPVLLSAPHSPESDRLYNELFKEKFEYFWWHEPEYHEYRQLYKKMTFGSGVSKWKLWEEKTIFQNQKAHFRRENYLILFDMAKFDNFVEFISKYMPSVTKLALLLDHDDYLENISTILNLYRKQLKVLLLERTNRSGVTMSCDGSLSTAYCSVYKMEKREFELSEKTYQSIDSLEALEELYFFPKWAPDYLLFSEDPNSFGRQSVERMLQKLRILHLNVYDDEFFSFQSDVYENLEEVCFGSPAVLFDENPDFPELSDQKFIPKKVSFPRLKKCFFLYSRNMEFLSPKQMPNLEEIGVYRLKIEYESLKGLNSFPKLEQTHSTLEYVYRKYFSRSSRQRDFIAVRDPRFPLHEDESGRSYVKLGKRLKHYPGPDILSWGVREIPFPEE